MSPLEDRLAELRQLLEHLATVRPAVTPEDLRRDLAVRHDVLFTLMMISQLVVDIAAQLSARKGLAFADYTEAVENLRELGFTDAVVDGLRPLPGFRNVLVHEYVRVDYDLVIAALGSLAPVEEFADEVLDRLEAE